MQAQLRVGSKSRSAIKNLALHVQDDNVDNDALSNALLLLGEKVKKMQPRMDLITMTMFKAIAISWIDFVCMQFVGKTWKPQKAK